MHGAGLPQAEVFLHLLHGRRRPARGLLAEPLRRALPGHGVDLAVVALGEPGLEPGVQFLQGRAVTSRTRTSLSNCFLEGPVETLDDAAALGHVGLGMQQLDAQGIAGGVEADGVERRAVVQVELHRQAVDGQELAETEAQGGEILGEVIAALDDQAAVVVDETQEQGPLDLVVGADPDIGAVVEVADHQFHGGLGLDQPEDGLGQGAPAPAGTAEPVEMAVQGGAGHLAPAPPPASRTMMSMTVRVERCGFSRRSRTA